MIINKISANYGCSYSNKNDCSVSPPFGYRTKVTRPNISNEYGELIYDKISKLITKLPAGAKMSRPSFLAMTENGTEKVYGILVDKSGADISTIIVKNTTNPKEEFKAGFSNKTGKMVYGDYDGIHFYRDSEGKDRKIIIGDTRFAPVVYGGETWGLTTYGEHTKIIDSAERKKSPLSSLFWGLTSQNASVKV